MKTHSPDGFNSWDKIPKKKSENGKYSIQNLPHAVTSHQFFIATYFA